MNEEHIATADQKKEVWGYGEWVEEPDKVEWEYKGVKCKIQRNCYINEGYLGGLGHLCGYITIPQGNPWEKIDEDQIECEVHGGLTYCQKSEEGQEIGFDCAHLYDETPFSTEKACRFMMTLCEPGSEKYIGFRAQLERLETLNSSFGFSSIFEKNKSYKNIAFVKSECESLIDQMLIAKEVHNG